MVSKLKQWLYAHRNHRSLTFTDKLIYRLGDHNLAEMSGSLVYFMLLSIFPFLIALLNTLKFTNVFNPEVILEYISMLPDELGTIVYDFVYDLINSSSGGLLIVSIIAGLWTASNGINQVINNINRAYGIHEKRSFLIAKLLSILFAIALIVLIILLVVSQVFGQLILDAVSNYIALDAAVELLIQVARYAIPFIFMVIIFTLLYKFAPKSEVRELLTLKLILPGALFATIGIGLMTFSFGFYVSNFSNYSVTYGSLGGIIVMLIWMYLVSLMLLLGGEINATLYSMTYFPDLNKWPRSDSIIKNFIGTFTSPVTTDN
ncbi:YihY/virulence factor BrkB family protein [Peptoniphilus equinus]|uniref:YihY/virulence factor BrkB family protein n=1 Tax=Peptoniphilus equinus TaxID=3016343 RepID=A0ABY7QV45_9FIRM|nr:YihY/virulence factor BrkB family protein [Peptoniphilus equinus]WBW50145.1 YihY/virulence factor BrkB family protein [Peptoniphilus equinus]